MQTYLALLAHLLENGECRSDRTNTGTRSVFGYVLEHQFQTNEAGVIINFPLLTTKRVSFRNIITELMWFLRGDTNIKFLHDHGCTIWDEWADGNGNFGPIYGQQWRDWLGLRRNRSNEDIGRVRVDQIEQLVNGLIEKPDSRRHIVSAWNPVDVPHMALPPCHTLFQCYVHKDGQLDLQLYARSIDAFLGLPYNVASYGLLLVMLAHACGYRPGKLRIVFGDLHLYSNHHEQAREQISRPPRALPKLWLVGAHPRMPLEAFTHDNFVLEDYDPHPAIKAPIAV